MIRTTVLLAAETHQRLRAIARRRGVPLARLIREALERASEEEQPTLSFIAAVDVADREARAGSLGDAEPPIAPPVSAAPGAEEVGLHRRLAERAPTRLRV